MVFKFPLPPVQQFILDCADLASTLDSIDVRDHGLDLPATLSSGRTDYHALLVRRQALSPSLVEEGWVDYLLDGLVARLRSLESRIATSSRTRRPPAPCLVSVMPC